MNDELKIILREAQIRVNQVVSGYRVVLLEAERTEADVHSDVARALQDREAAGLSASNNVDAAAPLTLDGASHEQRELIERALEESRGIEVEK